MAVSSRLVVAKVDKIMGILAVFAARATASSPAGCASLCAAIGAIRTGMGSLPKGGRVMEGSTWRTGMRQRGRKRMEVKAWMLS